MRVSYIVAGISGSTVGSPNSGRLISASSTFRVIGTTLLRPSSHELQNLRPDHLTQLASTLRYEIGRAEDQMIVSRLPDEIVRPVDEAQHQLEPDSALRLLATIRDDLGHV